MINKKREWSGKNIIKLIFNILLLLVIVVIAAQIYRKVKRDEKNEKALQNYPSAIHSYLWDKYGKIFYVNPNYETYPGGPIPGKSYSPYIYEVHEKEEDGYVFNVRIYPVSIKDKEIDDIRDNYCWIFLNKETKKWFKKEFTGVVPQEYKFVLYSMYSISYYDYDEHIKPDLPLKAYFETRSRPVSLIMYMIIPPDDLSQNTECTEENIKEILNDFIKNIPNSKIKFYVLQAQTKEGYMQISERELENSRFITHGGGSSIRDLKGVKNIMEIEAGQNN